MKLGISGSLELKSGGQSVDIMGMLRDNPLFIRELSQYWHNNSPMLKMVVEDYHIMH